jgi:hypothetical protein
MASTDHEVPLELVRNRPDIVRDLFRILRIELPDGTLDPISGELTELTSGPNFADLAMTVTNEGETELGVVFEVQRSVDEDKPYAWPAYIARLRYQLRRPVRLLVLATTDAVARWARRPIEMGHPGFTLAPLVITLADIPRVTDAAEAARNPELAMLSALAHRGDDVVGRAAFAALATLAAPEGTRALYFDIIAAAHRRILEELKMGYPYQSEFARKYFAEGREEGLKEGLEEARRVVFALIRAKVRVLTPDDERRIRALTGTQLADLAVALMQTADDAEARALLARTSPS